MGELTEKSLFDTKKERDTWSRSVEVNGITKEIRVREADNDGYIIRLNAYGDFPKEDGNGKEYQHREKEFISKTNPLATKDDEFQKSMDAIEELVSDSIDFNEIS